MSRHDIDAPGELGAGLSWVNQWPEWRRVAEFNWVNMDIVHIGVEAGSYTGRYVEAKIIVLGLGAWIEVYKAPEREAFATVMEERAEEAMSGEANLSTLEDCPTCEGMGSLFVDAEGNGEPLYTEEDDGERS